MLNQLLQPFKVGDIYLTVDDTNPSDIFGGTWELLAPGKTLVCIDTSDTDFDTVERIGGEKTHKLTVGEMPPHAHTVYSIDSNTSGTWTYGAVAVLQGSAQQVGGISRNTSTVGKEQSHNNLQPYITCYMWKRTA